MCSVRLYCTGCLLAAFAFTVPQADAQFEELAAKVPSTANAIMLLDSQKLLASPLAQKEGWKDKYDQAFASGLVTVSPTTRRMILASELDYEYMRPRWELAIADFTEERQLATIARNIKGTLDQIGDSPVVVLGDNSYCVQFSPTRLGIMAPANRQAVARWVRDSAARTESGMSPYLQASLTAADTSGIVMAFDLQDAIPPAVIRAKLAASSTFAGKKIDLDAAAKALEGLRGMVLEVAMTDGSFGRLRVHFNTDASVIAPLAKPLLLEVLGAMGAMIDDIREWEVSVEAERFTFSGPLSAAGRKRVFSLIDHPTAALLAADPAQATAGQESNQAAYATQQYFKSIMTIQDDLRGKKNDAVTFGQQALWLDNWARRVDRLPILDVDPEMLAFGRYTTARMRDMSAALKGIGISSAAQEAQVYQQYSTSGNVYGGAGYNGYGGGYSYYNQWNNVAGQRRAIGAQEKARGANVALGISREMEDQTVKVRQAMTQKFKINF